MICSYHLIPVLCSFCQFFVNCFKNACINVFTCFLTKYNVLFKRQFQNKHSTNHTLISLVELKKYFDNSYFICGVFVNFQKAFDTVDQDSFLVKLEHYGVLRQGNDWWWSCLIIWKQYLHVNGVPLIWKMFYTVILKTDTSITNWSSCLMTQE